MGASEKVCKRLSRAKRRSLYEKADDAKKVTAFYDFAPIMSRNAVFNFVTGGRGIGKTYGAKRMAIKHFFERGEQFIYLRRYKSEQKAANTFFADIAHEFPGWEFRVRGRSAEVRRITTADEGPWKEMGFFICLSNALTQKSVAYPKVTLIIFDEFIIMKGALHYLPGEVDAFLELYSTVDRWKDKTRVLFLANSVSIMNPYFMKYDIRVNKEWYRDPDGFVVAHFPKSEAFATQAYQTRFGKFIAGSEYAEYSLGSSFHDANMDLIEQKSGEAVYMLSIETATGVFSVWGDFVNEAETLWYVTGKVPREPVVFTTEIDMMREDKQLLEYGSRTLSMLRTAFSRGRVRFDNPKTRNSFSGIYKR